MSDFTDADEVLAFVDRIRERNQRMQESLAGLPAQTGEGFSADGTRRAEVGTDAIVAALDIPDDALCRGGHLAAMILTAIREAQAARALRIAESTAELSPAAAAVLAKVREAMPSHVRETIEQRRPERNAHG